jgi:predicted dehydrogenase
LGILRVACRLFVPGLTGAVLVRFESGAIGCLVSSWAFSESPVGYSFQVSGVLGSLAGSARGLVHGISGFPGPAERAFDPVDTFTLEIAHFLEVVLDGAECQASFAHAARVLQVILGAYRSAAEKRTVALPEDPTKL